MEGMEIVGQLMAFSATTAPKSKGENFVKTKLLTGDSLQTLAQAMEDYGQRTGKKDFDRDAGGVRKSGALLLVGIKDATVLGLDCSGCGFSSCRSMRDAAREDGEFTGPQCAFRLLDLGIALGSAVKTAGLHNIDNRIMYRAGVVAREQHLVDWDIVMGIPLSVTGKNIFFDR